MLVRNDKAAAAASAAKRASTRVAPQAQRFKAIRNSASLAKGMEELSCSISQSRGKKKSVHIKRKSIIKDKKDLKRYFKQSTRLNKDGLFYSMMEEVRNTKFKTRRQLLGYIGKKLENIGDQFLFLEKLKDEFQNLINKGKLSDLDAENIEHLLKLVDKSLSEILNKEPTKLLASLNVSNAIYKFQNIEPNKQAQGMLKFYFNAVIGYQDLADVLRYIQQNFDAIYMFESIEFLLEATAADLASPSICMQEVKLRVINNDIYNLRVLKELYKRFYKMLDYLRKKQEEEDEQKGS